MQNLHLILDCFGEWPVADASVQGQDQSKIKLVFPRYTEAYSKPRPKAP